MCDQCSQLYLNNVSGFDNEWQVCKISVTNWGSVHGDIYEPNVYIHSINLQKNSLGIKEV